MSLHHKFTLLFLLSFTSVFGQFQWQSHSNGSNIKKEHLRNVVVTYPGDSLHIIFPDTTWKTVRRIESLNDYAKSIFVDQMKNTGLVQTACDSLWNEFTSNYKTYSFSKKFNCDSTNVFCGEYLMFDSLPGGIIGLKYSTKETALYIQLQPDGFDISVSLLTVSDKLLSSKIASVMIKHDVNYKKIRSSTIDKIASDFIKDKTAKEQKTKDQIAEKAKAKALADIADSLRPFLQDMALERDTAFTISLTKVPNSSVKVHQAKWKKINNKSTKTLCVKGDTLVGHLTVDSVWVNFSHYVIATIRVYGRIGSESITFINIDPLPIASLGSIERTKNALLVEEIRRKRKATKRYIRFTDVISIDPGKGAFITDYIPKDEPILLDNAHSKSPVMKASIASSFRVNAFSDLNGFLEDKSPNGKVQTEALCIIPMRTKSTFRTGTTFFKDLLPEICVSKLGDDNRLLTVNIDTTKKIKYVNHFDVIQHVNFWGGMRMNIFTIDSRNTNSTLFMNFRVRFMRTELADTLGNSDHLFNTLSAFYELEFYYRRSLSKLFSVDISFSAGLLKLYNNSVHLSYGPGYDDYRQMTYQAGVTMHPDTPQFFKTLSKTAPMFVYTPQMIIKYKLRKNIAKAVFIRISFPNSFSVNNGYLITQFGFSSPITSVAK